MSKIIDFPNKHQRLLKLGQEALSKKQPLKAIEYFSEAYEMEADFSLNMLLANCYLEIGESANALRYAEEYKNEYSQDCQTAVFYLQILIGNRLFLEGYHLLKKIKKNDGFSEEAYQELADLLARNEAAYLELQQREIQQLRGEFQNFPERTFIEQAALLKKARKLPKEIYFQETVDFLVNPQVFPIIRGKILEEFVYLDFPGKVHFLTVFDTEEDIDCQQLSLPEESRQLQSLVTWLRKHLENQDPVLLEGILEEVYVFSSLLFPKIDDIITDSQLWGGSYLQEFAVEEPDARYSGDELEAIFATKKRLRDALQEMINTSHI